MKLYTYYRSSAAYRVRIALHLKALPFEAIAVHLIRDGGQQKQASYLAQNPQGLVPLLTTETLTLPQSLAIIEWLDETHPQPALLPTEPAARARVRAIAQAIACDIHPLNNLRVLRYLSENLGMTDVQKKQWYRHWVNEGLMAVEQLLAQNSQTGTFCHGEQPSLADCCLVPQVFNGLRFGCDLGNMPIIRRIVQACDALPAFQKAAPANQPDAE